ncbi:MAG: 1-acyl-sn-glycerol-3-phosphate acyltransferase [Deltaproteobacteria bacterium]|nr:1-acyl-sn-glycerol-3-phosphate acyltransferase [Deltaproteobacteria bacterium]
MSSQRGFGSTVGTLLATITGNLYLVVGGLVFGMATTLFGLVLPAGKVFRFMGRWYGRTTLWACGAYAEAVFEEDPERAGNSILMPNHQSLFDIPALLATLPGETRFLAKQSLFKIPIFGWALRTGGFIPVDRGNRSRGGETFRSAIDGLDEGVSILLFPEETRSSDGRLQEFKRGGFLMALRSGLPIVPVGIDGSFRVRRKSSWLIRPGKVTVHYGRAVSSDGLSLKNKKELMTTVRQEIVRLAKLDVEESGVETPRKGQSTDGH